MATALDSFLLELRNAGRISEIEYSRAYYDSLPLSEGSVTVSNPITRRQLQVVHQVFNVTELLELILSYLSPVAQLSVRGVCRGFQAVVEKSPTMVLRGVQDRKHTEPLSLPPFGVRGVQMGLTKTRGVLGVSAVLDLGVQSGH